MNSIDTALDERNYDPIEVPLDEWTTYSAPLAAAKSGTNGETISWTNKSPQQSGRNRVCDVVKGNPRTKRTITGKAAVTPRKSFELFVTSEMVSSIVCHTNQKIDKALSELPTETTESGKNPCYCNTDDIEICALLGIFFFHGLLGLNNHRVNILFSERAGHHVFGGVMSRVCPSSLWHTLLLTKKTHGKGVGRKTDLQHSDKFLKSLTITVHRTLSQVNICRLTKHCTR